MPQITYRANLSAAVYPMTVADAGRTVIIPGPDQNFDRRVDPAGEQKDAGIPQAMYMENVLPTTSGYQSVGFIPQANSIALAGRTVSFVKEISITGSYSASDSIVPIELIFYTNNTVGCMFADATTPEAAATLPGGYVTPFNGDDTFSVAYVKGVIYAFDSSNNVLYSITSTFFLGDPAVTFTDITASLVGILPADIVYITGAFNYLIAVTTTVGAVDATIQWSSLLNPVDFTASLVSGAGSEIVSAVRTTITHLREHPVGFYIYCQDNVIVAKYTGNARYPWKFIEVDGSGGYAHTVQISSVPGDNIHYGMEEAGKIQLLAPDGAQIVAPEVTDYFERVKYFDTFNQVTNVFGRTTFVTETLETPPFSPEYLDYKQLRRIWYFLDRYLIISYGTTEGSYLYAIIYDKTLQRYGKLCVAHSHIFSSTHYLYTFNKSTGAINQIIYDVQNDDAVWNSVLVLGKFQYVRSRWLSLEEVVFESAQDLDTVGAPTFSVAILPTLDGKNFSTPVVPPITYQAGSLRTYNCHIAGQNVAIVAKGAFDLNTLQLVIVPGGDR